MPVFDFGIWTRIFHNHNHRIFASSDDLWRHNPYGGWATLLALSLLLLFKLLHYFFFSHFSPPPPPHSPSSPPTSKGDGVIITEDDLKSLILSLDDAAIEKEKWDDVIEKRSPTVYYKAKCCKPEDGPCKYLSVTEFANYSTDVLRDFYMDNEYRTQWDKTVVEHVQLCVDEATGIEMGRTIKKLPLLTAREYVLAWRLWEGKDNTYYCVTKACEHPLAPRSRKYVRVDFYKSGWRIRKVPGKNASEIKMIYQEDSGMNVEMAKLAFAKGVWGYICKMESALQKYSEANRLQLKSSLNAITLAQKVPQELEAIANAHSTTPLTTTTATKTAQETQEKKLLRKPSGQVVANGLFLLGGIICLSCVHNAHSTTPSTTTTATSTAQETEIITQEKKLLRKPSGQVVAKGLFLLGGIICLSRGHTSVGAKVVMGYLLTKLNKHCACSSKPSDKRS